MTMDPVAENPGPQPGAVGIQPASADPQPGPAGTSTATSGEPSTGIDPAAGGPFDPDGVRWTPVSGQLAKLRRTVLAVSTTVPTVLALVLAAVLDVPWLFGFPVLAALVAGFGWWLIGRQVRAWGYAEREDDLLVRRGVMFREMVVVPYGRMQYVDVQAGPVERAFGIARVQLHTASARSDARIPGLSPLEAARVRDRLASRGQAQLAGL